VTTCDAHTKTVCGDKAFLLRCRNTATNTVEEAHQPPEGGDQIFFVLHLCDVHTAVLNGWH
jgi:hypothetical protein